MTDLLKQIHEDVDVYDAQDNKIGRVAYVYMGSEGATPDAVEETDLKPDLPGVVASPKEGMAMLPDEDALDSLPHDMRNRLLMQGYVKVKRMLLIPDAVVMAEHIEHVTPDRVTLNISKDALITL